MKCPYCSSKKTRVVDKRSTSDLGINRRRRECLKCGKRFTTYERVEVTDLVVIKRDGRKESFNREKLRTSILKACEKRPISYRVIERIVNGIERKIRNLGKPEVKTELIGEMVMEKLKALDEVAYVRFASYYREFTDVKSFEKELKKLRIFRKGKKITKVKRRDGRIVKFDQNRITEAIWKAAQAVGGQDKEQARMLSDEVVSILKEKFTHKIPTVEEIQDIVEKVLVENGHAKTAKAFILYREQRKKARDMQELLLNVGSVVDGYAKREDWRVRENANMGFSFSGLTWHVAGSVMAYYALNYVYPKEVARAHIEGDYHLHDLSASIAGYSFYRNETVIVRQIKTKKILTLSLEQLFDLVNGPILKENGFELKYTDDYEILDEDGWTPIIRVLKHKTDKPLISFNTEGGHNLIVTNDHDFITFKEEKKIVKCPRCRSKDVIKTRSNSYRKTLEPHHVDYYRCKDCEKTFCSEVDKPKEEKILKKAFEVNENNYALTPAIWNKIRSGIKLRKSNLDSMDGWFLGFFLADGFFKGNYLAFDGLIEGTEYHKLISYLQSRGIKYNVYQNNGHKTINILKKSLEKGLESLFTQIRPYAENKNLPLEFFQFSPEFVGGVLGGIIDGDNIVRNDDPWVSRVVFRMTSKNLLSQIQYWLESQNIKSSLSTMNSYGERYFRGNKITSKKQLFRLSVYIPKVRKELFKECLKIDGNFKFSKKEHKPSKFSTFRKIEEVKNDSEYVYDITTGSGTFLCNGILVHNCAGWSLRQLLAEGYNGVPNRIESAPPKHLRTALGQMMNFLGTLQHEWAGAQAFSSFDTYLAPFVRNDGLNYKQVKQMIQEFVFNLNVGSRWGCQTPFTNITLDWRIPEDLKNEYIVIGGKLQDSVYGDYQEEVNMINKAFIEVMIEGDKNGRVFTFPIPTYNITKDFDWDSENSNLLFKMTGKYGLPYFQNFINSDLRPGDVRAMCCRLQLDLKELRKKTGGLFGFGESTGSLGVVTINMPKIGYLSKDESMFFERLEKMMTLAKNSLEIKRKIINRNFEVGLLPYTKRYLGHLNHHFSTIGLVGMNEACLNFFGKNIATKEGKAFAIKVLKFMRNKLIEFQNETGHIFNLEATPAEGSLAPEERVLISSSFPKLTRIGPLVDDFMEKNKCEVKKIGDTEILKLSKGKLFTYGFDRKEQIIKKYPVTAVIRHRGKTMYEITTRSGRKVRVTGQHSLFGIDDFGLPEKVKVKDLKKSMFIAVPKEIKINTNFRVFNLVEEFKNMNLKNYLYLKATRGLISALLSNKKVREWVKEHYKTPFKDVKYFWLKSKVIPLNVLLNCKKDFDKKTLKVSRLFYRKTKNTNPIKTLIKSDRKLGFILGCLLSEGWISERSQFTNTNEKYAKKFLEACKDVFGKGSCYLTSKKRMGRKPKFVVTLNKMVGFFFDRVLGLREKSYDKFIPNFILDAPKECIAGILEGFELGDGNQYFNHIKRDYKVRFSSTSKRLIEGLNILLLRLGISTKLKVRKKRDKREKDEHVLMISGVKNLRKYFRLVKGRKLSLNLKEINSGKEVIPKVPRIIKKILKDHELKPEDIGIGKDSLNRNVRRGRTSVQFLKKIIKKLDQKIEDERLNMLRLILKSSIFWDEIKMIRKLKTTRYVYDLEVDVEGRNVNNFLGGYGLVCLHNTSYRLARIDKKNYPNIITSGKGAPFYTNSTHLPVDHTDDMFEALKHQDDLQVLYTGGTVFHGFVGEKIDGGESVAMLVKRISDNFRLPYFTVTPTFSICPVHGYISGEHFHCPFPHTKEQLGKFGVKVGG